MRPQPGFAAPPATPAPRRRAGFTLVELLVVIGIIVVLAGLLLTVRSRASDQARSAQCMNNLRQIGLAMTMYAQANEQAFPWGSPSGPTDERKEDWIHYRAPENLLAKEVASSAIAPHARVKGEAFVEMMRCPADSPDTHTAGGQPYRFSYSMNYAMTSEPGWGKAANRGATPRVTAINRPAEKILVVEENELSIGDGMWLGGRYDNYDVRTSPASWTITREFLSIRHDTRKEEFADTGTFDGFLEFPTKRGNVLFVDGHTEFVTRRYAHSAQHILVSDEGAGVPKEK